MVSPKWLERKRGRTTLSTEKHARQGGFIGGDRKIHPLLLGQGEGVEHVAGADDQVLAAGEFVGHGAVADV